MAPQQKTVDGAIPASLQAGMRLAQPPPGDEVVISGVAGCFPDSGNMYQFRHNLMNKIDMVSDDDRRWTLDHPEIPQRTGKLLHVNKFDASFFGVHYKQAQTMDPMCRIMMEKAFEAIVDAGVQPRQLRGTKTGVFTGACFSESEKTWFYEKMQVNGFGITGCSRAMLANRMSYWLGINGPSYAVDSACSSSMYALEHAYKSIRDGHCDSALVSGCNLCLHPYVSLQFSRLGVLSPQGMCKVFDRDANGYARSEAVCVMFLQKARNAKRIYATVLHSKTNCDGYKEQGITYPSGEMQRVLLEDFYFECNVDPATVDYVEAHGTGTKVGDPEELTALDHVFCKGRKEPLFIGSIKSNIGHSEPASGMCSISKVILAMETGVIPPNLHYNNPREGVPALAEGRLKVVTENQPHDCKRVGINSFGFGGANAHVLLQWNKKAKINGGAPNDPLPRLVVASGRTEEAVDVILNDFESRPVDAEFVYLMQDLQSIPTPGHIYRGYILLTEGIKKPRSTQPFSGHKRPLWFVFTGMGSQWPGMGKSLMKIPIFSAAIEKCQTALRPHGIDVINIITSSDPTIFDNILHCFVGIAACQIGLVDVMKAIGIEPDGIVGHSVGELGCSYMDGSFTAEQMILAAYYRGRASIETKLVKGTMAAVGLGAQKAKEICPPDIAVACHNGPDVCTLSGPAESITKFVKTLQQKGIFAREVNCANIAYHSKYISSCGPTLLKYLKQVIPNPKPRSSRWVSSSIPESAWETPLATHSSAEYHTNNLLSPVLFEEASRHIPRDAITVEIAPHGLLQAILNRSLHKSVTNIAITQRGHEDSVNYLLSSIGKLYMLGLQPQLINLYPPIQYPVSRGTPMISPLIRWEHSEDWYVTSYRIQEKVKSGERTVVVSLEDEELEYLAGHVIDGRILFPAMGYVILVWESIALMMGQMYTDVSVVFESMQFKRATNIPKEGNIELLVMVQKGSGNFEISEGGVTVVCGSVRIPEDVTKELVDMVPPEETVGEDLIDLSSRDIYKELRLRGYNYQGLFRSLVCSDNLGTKGKVHWCNNWVAFMDNMLQMQILQEDTRGLFVPTSIDKLTIDTKRHVALINELRETMDEPEIPVYVFREMNLIHSGGVEVRGLKASAITKRKPLGDPVLEKHIFLSHNEPEDVNLAEAMRACMHIILENQNVIQVKAVEVYSQDTDPLSPELALILGDLPLIQADITLLANPDDPFLSELEQVGYKINDSKLSGEQNCILVIASSLSKDSELLNASLNALCDGGFILAREKDLYESSFARFSLEIVFEKTFDNEKLVLLKKRTVLDNPIIIDVTSVNYDWLPKIQTVVANSSKQNIYLIAQKDPLNGILGLVNCIRKEPGGENVRCVFILDNSAPDFDVNLPFYRKQLNKNIAINVYCNGKWGSYRHLPLKDSPIVEVPHAFANVTTRGDLSSLKWLEGAIVPGRPLYDNSRHLIHIYYSALNFRDIMTATGKLALEVVCRERLEQDCVQGLEFAGRTESGRRVMGMVRCGATANLVLADKLFTWDIPDHWSLEDAATVPVVYGTVLYAMVVSGRMRKGESILIHAGSGGVGQAAIHVALHSGLTVYTTVGTPEKREFLKKKFPQLTDRHIGNSRDTSFEQLIMLETEGKGVDMVLNSLAEEKLQASLRCLAYGGRFLEIGKFDLANNNPLGMDVFLKDTSFHGVMLDTFFWASDNMKQELHKLVDDGIKSGCVVPLTRTSFPSSDVEKAFRYMAAGKHIGKVLLKIRDEEKEKIAVPEILSHTAKPRYYCDPNGSYIVAGGLGGFGLELADWLVLRGATKLVLTSRNGLKTGYQASRIRLWRSYGVKVIISVDDITTKSGVKTIIEKANNLGPVDGIFNLAVVLRDALLENQTENDFQISAGAKAVATQHFDVLSRQMCPNLHSFVVFSSVSCGRGNAGQTNYGMSNSIMERICESRVKDGFPGLAVQWGAVGDVGLVADMQEENTEIVIGGTLPQKISSCLEELDRFLKQPCPVVASMVVAEKRVGSGGSGTIVDCVSNVLGIRDLKTVSLHSTLAELGMDSMMGVEIKQTLEREFEIFLTAQEIRGLTFARLQELSAAKQESESTPKEVSTIEVAPIEGIEFIIRVVGDEETASKVVLRLPSATGNHKNIKDTMQAGPVLFMLPGIEGVGSVLEPLAKNLKYQTVCLQLGYSQMGSTISEMAKSLIPYIYGCLSPGQPFNILGYSFGGLVALEIVLQLEESGLKGNLFIVDSSPDFMKMLLKASMGLDNTSDDELYVKIICAIFLILAPKQATSEAVNKLVEDITPLEGIEEKLKVLARLMPEVNYSVDFQKAMVSSIHDRVKAIQKYEWHNEKSIKSKTVLVKPPSSTIVMPEDYGLSKICNTKVDVHVVPGNHVTILDTLEAAAVINKKVESEDLVFSDKIYTDEDKIK
uniref:Fatty acid synthase n=1 Tax=Blattella germanica TaxID=6973 RepID=A0A5B7QWQ9_BLAGE|nr:fatty acid synthase 1 [Blattella germanica]